MRRYGYKTASGRANWPSRDPIGEEGGILLYHFVQNNPIVNSDYLGLLDIKSWAKDLIKDSVTATAEALYEFLQEHPLNAFEVAAINLLVEPVKRKAKAEVDTNTKTMGWGDLTLVWIFEIPPDSFNFVDGDKTTEDLKVHEGVKQARDLAKANCKLGKHDTDHSWNYGVDQFFASSASGDFAGTFLGSYRIEVKSSSDCCRLDFTASNTSGWESGTRLRKGAKAGGQHQGVIKNRKRGGPGVELGGNIDQKWNWTETCKK